MGNYRSNTFLFEGEEYWIPKLLEGGRFKTEWTAFDTCMTKADLHPCKSMCDVPANIQEPCWGCIAWQTSSNGSKPYEAFLASIS